MTRTILAGRDFLTVDAMAMAADDIMLEQASLTTAVVKHTPTPSQKTQGQKTTFDQIPMTCWYHRKHGSNATKCKAPCNWQGNAQASH